MFPEVPDAPGLYDWLYHWTDKDVEMYRRLTRGHDAILEIGIGTGRLAIPLAEDGHEVVGIDYSQAMLDRLDEKLARQPESIRSRISHHRGDMRDFDLGRQFDFVFIPFGSFVYLLTIEDQLACLATLRKHLAPGGTLVIDVPTWEEAVDEGWLHNDPRMMKVKRARHPETDKPVEMWSTFRFDAASQLMEQDRHYRIYDQRGRLESEQVVVWRSRFFLFGEFRLLAALSGLEITDVYGDFDFGPFGHHSEVAVAVMRAAEKGA